MSRCTGFALGLGAAAALVASPARAHFVLQAPASWAEQGPPGRSAEERAVRPGRSGSDRGADRHGHVVRARRHRHRDDRRDGDAPRTLSRRAVDDGAGRACPPIRRSPRAARPAGRRRFRTRPCTRCSPTGCWCTPPAFSGPQSFTFKLPTNMTCTGNCVLQVAEFMSDHGLNNPGGCFYHHCANITIQASGGTDAGTGESGGSDSGCGCAAGRGRASALGLFAMLALVAARRRRTP